MSKITKEARERMAALNGANAMPRSFCGNVSTGGGGDIVKVTEPNPFAANGYGRPPFSAYLSFVNAYHAGLAMSSGLSAILRVFAAGNASKVTKCVKRFIAVNMINKTFRPNPGAIQNSKPVRVKRATVNSYCDVPPSIKATCCAPKKLRSIARRNFPNKVSCVLVVVKHFAQALCCKIDLSHAVVPYKQWGGQKPRSASNTSRLRHFNSVGLECLE